MPRGKGNRGLKRFFYCATALLALLIVGSLITYIWGKLSLDNANLIFSTALSLLFSFSVVSYLLYKGKKPKKIVGELGLSRKSLSWKMVGYGLTLFMVYIVLILAASAIASITNTQISSNVQQVIGTYPLWAIIFIAFIAPINEEILFRGFLVPRVGVIASGIIFALGHIGYGSFIEIAVALWFGFAGGYVFKKTKSLYPSLITHNSQYHNWL